MITEEHPDVTKTIEILSAQVIRIRNGHHTINLAQDALIAEAGGRIIKMTIIGKTRRLNTSPIPSYQQEWRTKTGMQTLLEQQWSYSKHTHWMTTLPCMITTQTLLNLSLAVIQVESSSPAETPPILNYKAALSLRKKKTLYCRQS